MSDMVTIKIRIWGIVQGVGFRPFVAKLADRFGMKGEILNIGGLVDIILTDTPDKIEAFIGVIKKEKPLPAEIVHIKTEELELRDFNGFNILVSDDGDDEAAMLPADLSICPACLSELESCENPRYQHPFISCMVCGPRYSIIDRVPYDRANTTMNEFKMCDFCQGEYSNLNDRRYHAQTISCNDCGPMLYGKLSNQAAIIKDKEAFLLAVRLINEGRIIALKGVGGYNFICSPFIESTIKAMRRLKMREEKPFAVMFQSIRQIKEHCIVSLEEEKLLLSNAKPIVLLERKMSRGSTERISGDSEGRINDETYRTSRFIGAFLPSMGIQSMLIESCGPLIMTSANFSEMPIIKDDGEMFCLQNELEAGKFEGKNLAAVFFNERKILTHLDDSVVRMIDGQPQMIRRSKGYTPVPLYISNGLPKQDMILAVGGQLKAAFSLSKGAFAYISQYFGDLDCRETEEIYKENIRRMEELFRIKPKLVVCDLHPLYFTTKYAKEYANKHGIELLQVQHHHAHIASVMAEHDLQGPVIGVSFDGTGYGSDGAIWGGEFLICEGIDFSRAGHLEYIKMLGGDSSMKEGWKSAFSYLHHYIEQDNVPEDKEKEKEINPDIRQILGQPEDERWTTVKAGLEHDINTIMSSSMGRLFDGLAAFCGIHEYNRYEGECAIMLENSAQEAIIHGLEPWEMTFDISEGYQISAKQIFYRVEEALRAGIDKEKIALGFHYAVSHMILEVCRKIRRDHNINEIALTGGVFQNKILMERSLKLLRADQFSVYYNISVGPNDGGICLGQNFIGMKYLTGK